MENQLGKSRSEIGIYLREACKCPLLSREEEIDISKKIERSREEKYLVLVQYKSFYDEFQKIMDLVKSGEKDVGYILRIDDRSSLSEVEERWNSAKKIYEKNENLEGKLDELDDNYSITEVRGAINGNIQLNASRMLDFKFKFMDKVIDKIYDSFSKQDKEKLEIAESSRIEYRNKMTKSNTKLVVYFAKKYRGAGMDLADLIQEGNMGLIVAADRFDYRIGIRFSTYAARWIMQSIFKGVSDKSRTIRLPTNIHEINNKINRVNRKYLSINGRNPDPEHIAKELDIELDKVKQVQKLARKSLSLHESISEDVDVELIDFIEDKNTVSLVRDSEKFILREGFKKVLGCLSEQQREVIELRFGLNGNVPHTLEECGKIYRVSRERIRQIQESSIKKLGHPCRRDEMESLRNKINLEDLAYS